jgi:hypothetical protein
MPSGTAFADQSQELIADGNEQTGRQHAHAGR